MQAKRAIRGNLIDGVMAAHTEAIWVAEREMISSYRPDVDHPITLPSSPSTPSLSLLKWDFSRQYFSGSPGMNTRMDKDYAG